MATMRDIGIYLGRPLLPQLRSRGIELDQRMQQAWHTCSSQFVTELHMLTALRRLGAAGLECLPETWFSAAEYFANDEHYRQTVWNPYPSVNLCHPEYAEVALRFDVPIWCEAIESAGKDKTVTTSHFCKAISKTFLSGKTDEVSNVPPLLFFLAACNLEHYDSGLGQFEDIPKYLQSVPKTLAVLERLGRTPSEPDDFPYLLCLEEGKVVLRTVSPISDFRISTPGDRVVPAHACLTHFKQQFGAFTIDEIHELEDLIRNPKATEKDLQKFFENHQHFFRRWDTREVFSQVYLTRKDTGPLVPDFILTNPEVQRVAIVELKLPKAKVVRRQDNRDRFAECVMQARAQLLRYRDWFEIPQNREKLLPLTGMEIFRPNLAVVIGNSRYFQGSIERQELASTVQDIEVVTYDEILKYAKSRIVDIR